MKVLVTGARGFIGRNLCEHLDKVGIEVVALDMSFQCLVTGQNIKEKYKKTIQYQLGSYWGMSSEEENLVRECDVIVHLASSSHVDNSIYGPRSFTDLNVGGTLELYEICKNIKKEGRKQTIIQFSTDEVVSCLPGRYQAFEDSGFKCGSVYSATKAAQELLAQAYIKTWGLEIITTRCVNVFGKYQAYEKLIPKAIKAILTGGEVPVYGHGYQERQWVHVDHVCEFLNEVIVATFIPPGTILHITGTKEIPNLMMLQLVAQHCNKQLQIKTVEDRLGHDVRYALHKSSATSDFIQLDYEEKHSFLEDIKKTVQWYESIQETHKEVVSG